MPAVRADVPAGGGVFREPMPATGGGMKFAGVRDSSSRRQMGRADVADKTASAAPAILSLEDYLAAAHARHMAHANEHGCWHRSDSRGPHDPEGTIAWRVYLPGSIAPRIPGAMFQSNRTTHAGRAFRHVVTPPCDDEVIVGKLAFVAAFNGYRVEVPADFRSLPRRRPRAKP
jgi:hypothetical protein